MFLHTSPTVAGCYSNTGLDDRRVGATVVVGGEVESSAEREGATDGRPEQDGAEQTKNCAEKFRQCFHETCHRL